LKAASGTELIIFFVAAKVRCTSFSDKNILQLVQNKLQIILLLYVPIQYCIQNAKYFLLAFYFNDKKCQLFLFKILDNMCNSNFKWIPPPKGIDSSNETSSSSTGNMTVSLKVMIFMGVSVVAGSACSAIGIVYWIKKRANSNRGVRN